MLDTKGVIAYVGQNAAQYGLDPAAVLAVANHEGLNTAPGGTWVVPGEPTFSFGPPSWYNGGAGAGFLKVFGSPSAAWTPAGIDYWLQQVAQSAKGLTGVDAIRAIVTGFERPRADLVQGEIANAARDYQKMLAAIGNAGVAVPVPPVTDLPIPGISQPPTTNQNQTQINSPPTGSGVGAGTQIASFGGLPINVPSGMTLGLLGVLFLILGAVLFAFNVEMNKPVVRIGG